MLIIGIVGGIASGKSVVAGCFEEWGAIVLDADRAGHEVLQRTDVREQIRNLWGDSVFHSDGQVDRKQLGKVVFARQGGEQELARLEQITHPRIRELLNQQIEDQKATGQARVAILDAPLLLEAGWDQMCDLIVFVESSDQQRIARARQRGWSRSDFEQREASQLSLDEKRSRADYTIQNDDSLDSVRLQVARIWNEIIAPRLA